MHETLMQCFEWYLPEDGGTWKRLADSAPRLAAAGITKAWLPPAGKGAGGIHDPGYGVYDPYDLGEFPAHGTVRTKFGTKAEYLAAIDAFHRNGIGVLADIVLNHRMGGDGTEEVLVRRVDPDDQRRIVSDPFVVQARTRFTFPGRAGAYSDFTWDSRDFTGTSRHVHGKREVLLFDGKQWNPHVSGERGNFDYVLGIDVDVSSPRVREELVRWGQWFVRTTGVDGFRLDAVKHIDSTFFPAWLDAMRACPSHPSFAVGEYWGYDAATLTGYLDDCAHCMTLFDVPLHLRFRDASEQGAGYDLRQLFHDTLSSVDPAHAVTFVDNHDTQPGQSLESWVQPWFKPIAYAFILLRDCPYPCVFHGDWYGIPHDAIAPMDHLRSMAWIRANLLGDAVVDIARRPDTLCWLVAGDHPIVVVMSNAGAQSHRVTHGSLASRRFVDLFDPAHAVTADADGTAVFDCAAGGVSVFLDERDHGALRQARTCWH